MQKAKVFAETYRNYLLQLNQIDIKARAEGLGGKVLNSGITLRFFNREYYVDKTTIEPVGDFSNPSFAVMVILCKYLLMCPPKSHISNAELVTFRDFKDSGPLLSYFANNTNKTIEHTFSGNLENLRERCKQIGGCEQNATGYDLSVTFYALPKIPIILNFNDKDDMFGAKSSILYYADAERYLDMECIAITGTYLTRLLIKNTELPGDK